ncbi:MAG: ABC transporter permease [Anaerolinea sp.]|nr:ABC transporter permease [Anaerolinea sp.]MCC6974757.1 ABC transporter permease [Anaerolineae bacterium]
MNLKKVLLILRKDLDVLARDRSAFMIMIMTPLLITFVIAAAFANVSTGNAPIKGIRVAIVNQDAGSFMGNMGQILSDSLLKPEGELKEMLAAEALPDVETARAAVREGKYAAAILIPPEFSERLNPISPRFGDDKIQIEVYRDTGSTIGSSIIAAIARQFANGFANSSIALAAGGKANPALFAQAQQIGQDVFQESQANPPFQITTIAGVQDTGASGVSLISFFAPSMAVFFLNFTMAFAIVGIMEERDQWTLQRMLMTPTPRSIVLSGKLAGAYVSGILQLVILMIATSLFGPLFGITKPVWGTNLPLLVIAVPVTVFAAIGVGAIIGGLAKNRQQAVVLANAILILMGIAGGSFFATMDNRPMFGPLSYGTVNYWANNLFFGIAQDQTPMLSIGVLLAYGLITFVIGMILFNRKLEV